jgi:hypothetical protein
MPSSLHEGIAELFRNRPELAAEVIERYLRLELPEYQEARLASGDLSKLRPAERRADAVVILQRERHRPVLGLVVEVQLKEDRRKRRSWPDYLTGLHSRHNCPVALLVICPSRRTATWAAEPITVGPGFVLRPFVLGPDLVPVIRDVAQAVSAPELAVLSGIAHGTDKAAREAAFAAVAAVAAHDIDLAALYADVIVAELPKRLRKTAEEELRARTIEYGSDFARAHHAQGKAEGLAEGEARGEAKGEAKAVLAVLNARGIEITRSQATRIRRCTSLAKLDMWLERAATAKSADEIFA